MTEEQIIRLYGKRCAEYCPECCVCEVWAMHDLIETQAREIERLNTILSEMNDTDVIARTMAENERLRGALWNIEDQTDTDPETMWIADLAHAALAGDSHDQ